MDTLLLLLTLYTGRIRNILSLWNSSLHCKKYIFGCAQEHQ